MDFNCQANWNVATMPARRVLHTCQHQWVLKWADWHWLCLSLTRMCWLTQRHTNPWSVVLAALQSLARADAADLLQAPARATASTYLHLGPSASPATPTRASPTKPAQTATHRPPGKRRWHPAMHTFLAVSAMSHWGPQQDASPCNPQRARLPKSRASPAPCRAGASSLNQSSRAGSAPGAASLTPAMRSLSQATHPLPLPAKRPCQQWLQLPLQQLLRQLLQS